MKNTWIIATEARRLGGIMAAVKPVSERVTLAVVGAASLASELAGCGADRVVLFEVADDVPCEAVAADVANAAAADSAQLVASNDTSSARMILGAVAGKIGAAVLGNVQDIRLEGDNLIAGNLIANAKAVEDVASCVEAIIYTGEDADLASDSAVTVEAASVNAPVDRIVGFEPAAGTGLATASRVVGVGMGLAARDNLPLVEDLATAMGAEIACTLPCCDDMRWYPSERVLGSSHNSAAPDLYIAVGISGSPNHTSGFRDAKVVVSINNNPDAEIFSCSKYGITGDLFKIVPVLTAAFK